MPVLSLPICRKPINLVATLVYDYTNIIDHSAARAATKCSWLEPFNEPAVAGGSIGPRVKPILRGGTLGVMRQNLLSP